MCYPEPTVLDDYEAADLVITAHLVSLVNEIDPKSYPGGDVSAVAMTVEKVYKGDVKTGDKIQIGQGIPGLTCTLTFFEPMVGEKFLLYLRRPAKSSNTLATSRCSGSGYLKYAHDHLLYLDKMDKVLGRTRVYGRYVKQGSDDSSLAGRKIRFRGKNRTYVATTDKEGSYELYGMTPGRYVVDPELPSGWIVDNFHLTRKLTEAEFMDLSAPSRAVFTLLPKRHFRADVELRRAN
jgi:hypothetical protein